ncbi:Sodium/calcium exchanger 2 [Melipona quadrifasciata]|uniref:Sodium/calcium exchanger 2 n=1 Tax=Melipona quadrifasciata TaxID=166423 RepID=A0A0M8ZWK1_9HYME|nr:Sodium/calcium exchanger 2 [Melipona quadrifasciata]
MNISHRNELYHVLPLKITQEEEDYHWPYSRTNMLLATEHHYSGVTTFLNYSELNLFEWYATIVGRENASSGKISSKKKNEIAKENEIYEKRVFSGTSSWKEQFTEALTVSSGDDDEGEGTGEAAAPSTLDYLMHGLTILWKVLFAFVPPTGTEHRDFRHAKKSLKTKALSGA